MQAQQIDVMEFRVSPTLEQLELIQRWLDVIEARGPAAKPGDVRMCEAIKAVLARNEKLEAMTTGFLLQETFGKMSRFAGGRRYPGDSASANG